MILRRANIYDSNDIAKVHVTNWAEFYKDKVSPEFFNFFDFEYRKKYWVKFINDGRLCFVLEEKGGSIDGFIVPRITKLSSDENIGEVVYTSVNHNANYAVNTAALLYACAKLFSVNFCKSMYLWLHRDSSLADEFRNLGGVETGAKIERMDSRDMIKIKIEWNDLSKLLPELEEKIRDIILDL